MPFIKLIKSLKILVVHYFFDNYFFKSYSQEGEDMILNKIFEFKKNGFYIDIGAHHPKRFSNTYFFYKKGWMGINVDAKPGSMYLFNKIRPRDINLEIGLNNEKSVLKYYSFNEPALNTFDKELADERSRDSYVILEEINVKCIPLDKLLEQYLPDDKTISFLSIDIEGFDLKVLETNNWVKYRPEFIVVESYKIFIEDVIREDMYKYLKARDYSLISKSYFSLIFKDTVQT